jgi:hypothetical protein
VIVRPGALKELLRRKGANQVGEDALIVLAAALESEALLFAEESVAALERRNESRRVQRIPRLRRLTVADVEVGVEEGLRRMNGKS